jgi:hypothetical protein
MKWPRVTRPLFQNKRLRDPREYHLARPQRAIFISDATNHDSSRHAAKLQLLAKRVLLLIAMSLNSKKILTIGIRIRSVSQLRVSIQGGHCSVQSIQKVAA